MGYHANYTSIKTKFKKKYQSKRTPQIQAEAGLDTRGGSLEIPTVDAPGWFSFLFFQRKTITFLPAPPSGNVRLSLPARVNITGHLGCVWHAAQMECPDVVCCAYKSLLFFWLGQVACGILVPQPGIKPGPLALGAQSLNLWTNRQVLSFYFSIKVIHTPCFVLVCNRKVCNKAKKKCPVPPLLFRFHRYPFPRSQQLSTLWLFPLVLASVF